MRDHGYARYRLDGCRCYVCALACSDYNTRRNRLIAYGQWEPFVPIEETRFRVQNLADIGFGDRSIAALAGLGRSVVRNIRLGYRSDPARGNPTLTKIRKDTAAAIAAIPFDPMAAPDGAYIDGAKTWERIGYLLEAGYTRGWIALQIGRKTPALQLGKGKVTVRAARQIQALCERTLGDTDFEPVDEDDIDEMAVVRRAGGDRAVPLNSLERREVVRRLTAAGKTAGEIQACTGIDETQVKRDRERERLSA